MKKPALLRIPRFDWRDAVGYIERVLNRLLVESSAVKFDYFFIGDNIPTSYNYVVNKYNIPAPLPRVFTKMTVGVEDDGTGSGGIFGVTLHGRRAGSTISKIIFQIEIDTSSSPGSWFSSSTDTVANHPYEELGEGDSWSLEIYSDSGTHRNVTIGLEYNEYVPYTGRSGNVD